MLRLAQELEAETISGPLLEKIAGAAEGVPVVDQQIQALQDEITSLNAEIEALRIARERLADAIRLDAYDSPAGAGAFYEKCGFRQVGRVIYRNTPLLYYEMMI